MVILTQPASFSLSGNLEKFQIRADETISFILMKGTEEILSASYTPGSDQAIVIDLREIVESHLSFRFIDQQTSYVQESLVADFTAIIDGTEYPFRVLRGGVDRLGTTAENFCRANFLTWQPQIKPVTYYTPEFLGYYCLEDATVYVKAYFTAEDGNVTSEVKAIATLFHGYAYTIPVQYAVICSAFDSRFPSFYDVWVQDSAANRLTYVQRYVADNILSEQEEWILFENSLGGIDTFRAYGQSDFKGKHTHNVAEIDDVSLEYRVDTERTFQKSTGFLNNYQRRWLLDFFPSKVKYVYVDNYIRSIVVTDDNTTYTDKELPTEYKFTYRYADARPYLNLSRSETLPSNLDIVLPELGSFTIPPRLVEFPTQPLSEGVLLPVQNPFSEDWATITVGAILNYVLASIMSAYDGRGGFGHVHPNYDLLNLLSYVEGYLLVGGEKIKAGYADEVSMSSLIWETFIRKDKDDKTHYLLSLLAGTIIKKWAKFGDFVTNVQGGYIDEGGNLEMESGVFRKRLFVPEIAYNRITYFKGRSCVSPGGGCTVLSYVDNGDGSYTITPDLTDADGLSQFVDDILTTYFVYKSDEGKLQGFEEMKFRVSSADYDKKTFVIVPRPGYDYKPAEQMVLAQTGNFTDIERQNYILIDSVNGNCCITFYEGANTWDVEPAQEPSWLGKKKGRTVAGINCDNYSAVLQNILMTGRVFQIDEVTGGKVRVPIDKGKWSTGKYGYYDRVTHAGCLWLCVAESGTELEPSDSNADWLKEVEKGAGVQSQGEWKAEKTPVPANTIMTLAGGAFITKRETSLPPIACWMIDGQTYALTDEGSYALMGNWADYGHTDDWDVLFDIGTIVDGKDGTSVIFLGSYAVAPTNPKEGWAYYNSTDKCSYVYQSGSWKVMVRDGKDGKDYEWVYCRTKVEESPAQPYSDPDKDDYVPPEWTDDPQGINEEYRYEWACKRVKSNGKWGDFSKVALVYRWADRGADGKSINPAGSWSCGNLPRLAGDLVSFAGKSFIAKKDTYLPPIACWKIDAGTYALSATGSYVLMGSWEDYGHSDDWQLVSSDGEPAVSYWIDIPITAIHFTSTGTPSPSSFLATCKKSIGDSVYECSDLFLAVRRLKDTTWYSAVSPTKGKSISIAATAGYTQFCVRAYKTLAEANSWSESFLAEKGVTVVADGAAGAVGPAGSFPYDAGVWTAGQSYVWDSTKRHKVIHPFDGVYYNFLVRNFGAVVTAAPTSATGDSNWEAMNKFVNIATDTLFADGANVANFMFKAGVMRSQNETDGVPNMILNGKTGYFHCVNADISGIINAISGTFNNVTFNSGILAGFEVKDNSIISTLGAYDGGSGVNGFSSSKFFLHAGGSDTAFIGFSATNKWAGIGLNTMSSVTGIQAMGRFEDTATDSFTYTKIGLYISVAGATTYDSAYMHGNCALYIPKGHIAGYRRRFRRLASSATLTTMDSVIRCVNTTEITVTLPSDAEDGQEFWLTSANGKKVNVKAGSTSHTITGGASISSGRWYVYIFDAYNKNWHYSYMNI